LLFFMATLTIPPSLPHEAFTYDQDSLP